MFFKKKEPKIDPKIRFQNRQFNQKLQQARTFKRTSKAIPEGQMNKFLTRIGLGSIWRQTFALIIVGGLLYLVYLPNFLTLQSVVIVGMSETDRGVADSSVQTVLNDAKFYDPQRNLLFLSKDRLREALGQVAAVDSINSIDKDFKTKTVTINVTSKYEKFLVRSSEQVYDVYKDGSTKGVAGVDRDYWMSLSNPGMVKMDVHAKIINPDNRTFLNKQSADYVLRAESELAGIKDSPLAYISIVLPEFRQPVPIPEDNIDAESQPDSTAETQEEARDQDNTELSEGEVPAVEAPILVSPSEVQLPMHLDELEFVLRKGSNSNKTFRVRVDTKESAHDVVQRLNLLLSQTPPDRYNNLSYIDLRIKSRAFVCLIGAPCNK